MGCGGAGPDDALICTTGRCTSCLTPSFSPLTSSTFSSRKAASRPRRKTSSAALPANVSSSTTSGLPRLVMSMAAKSSA
ncbi:hypothetical protein [Deinococcus sp. KNUC1210]|uniref:hypothetical protein n=1 Tax=Deinococcus sp. KNUC1210 TaxID=2917691 RepID=UPI00351D50D4